MSASSESSLRKDLCDSSLGDVSGLYPALGVSKLSLNHTGTTSESGIGPSKIVLIRTGTGRAYPECTTYKFTIACSNQSCDTKPIHVRCNCHRLSCPECMKSEAMTQARKIDDRLIGLTKTYEANNITAGKVKHWAISKPELLPESKKDDKKAVRKYIKACIHILKAHAKPSEEYPNGFCGGVGISILGDGRD